MSPSTTKPGVIELPFEPLAGRTYAVTSFSDTFRDTHRGNRFRYPKSLRRFLTHSCWYCNTGVLVDLNFDPKIQAACKELSRNRGNLFTLHAHPEGRSSVLIEIEYATRNLDDGRYTLESTHWTGERKEFPEEPDRFNTWDRDKPTDQRYLAQVTERIAEVWADLRSRGDMKPLKDTK